MNARWGDRALRAALRLADAVAGPFSPRLRAVCRYGAGLIDSGGGAEFRALVRQRLRLAVARSRRPRARASTEPAIAIDSRHQRLLPDGTVVNKSAWCRPGDLAPFTASVVIPCFNYGAYLGDALDSVRHQTLGQVEVIVVDDGSTDEETRTCLAALERSETVRVVRRENRGLSAARNAGIAVASGEYVCCLDADDRIEPTYLEQAVALLESDRSLGFVGSWVRFFGDASGVWQTRDFEADQALAGNFTSVASVFRRDDWAMLGGYTETMRDGFEDWEFWIRLASAGRRGTTIARPLLLHRRHGRNMTDTAKARELTLRAQMRAAFPAFYDDPALRARLTRLGARADEAPLTLTAAGNGAGGEARRLLVVVTGLLDGGAHTLLADILGGLGSVWRATIVTTGPGPHTLEARFSQVTDDIVHLHGFLPAERWAWFLDHLIRSRRIDAVLSSDCRWHLEQLPRLRTAFPTLALLELTHNHVPTRSLREAMARSPQLDRHVVVSGQVVSALTGAGIPGTRIVHVANGVDPEQFAPQRLSREVARQRFDAAFSPNPGAQHPGHGGSVRLLWVGRMEPVKRPTLFVDLVAALLAQGRQVTGLMIGDGPLADDVEAHIRHTGLGTRLARLPFTPRAELPAYYVAADLFVLTSAVEGMPLVVLEAMACGCPVASTDVGDVAQVVVPDVNGLLLAPDSNETWASSVAGFLDAQASPDGMRAAAAAAVREGPFTVQVMAARWAALLDEVVEARVRQ